MKRILIVIVAGIGDLVLASMAIRAIRNGNPDAEIHILTSSDAESLALNYRFVDRVWPFPIRELRKSKRHLFKIFRIVQNLRTFQFDKIINLYRVGSRVGALKMGLFFLLLKGHSKIGHGAFGFDLFLTKSLPTDTFENRHCTEGTIKIAEAAGGIPDEKGIEIFWDKNCEDKWNYLLRRRDSSHLLVGINPGGDRENRRWGSKNYADVADRLADRFDLTLFILGGPGEEPIAGDIRLSMKHDSVDLSGKLSLNDLAYVISRLDLLVTNDSGPMHIGAATGTPLVAVFGPEDPINVAPYTSPDLFRIIYKEIACRPCGKKKCRNFRCLDLITPDEVIDKCLELLRIHKPFLFDS